MFTAASLSIMLSVASHLAGRYSASSGIYSAYNGEILNYERAIRGEEIVWLIMSSS